MPMSMSVVLVSRVHGQKLSIRTGFGVVKFVLKQSIIGGKLRPVGE